MPKTQLNAFKVIVRRIEWLLKDEIASALINTSPVTEATLDNVADHVRNSTAENCQFQRISLRFVCGLEKSLQLFLAELSKGSINKFRLVKKGMYFYLAGGDSASNGNGDEGPLCAAIESITTQDVDGRAGETIEEQKDSEAAFKADKESRVPVLSFCDDESSKLEEDNAKPNDSVNVYEFCEQIILDAFELSFKDQEDCKCNESSRSRSGSVPIPTRESGDIIRRRFSDTGISYTRSEDLSLNLDDWPQDLQGFQQNETPRKTGPDFWLFASVQGSEVIVFFHKRLIFSFLYHIVHYTLSGAAV